MKTYLIIVFLGAILLTACATKKIFTLPEAGTVPMDKAYQVGKHGELYEFDNSGNSASSSSSSSSEKSSSSSSGKSTGKSW